MNEAIALFILVGMPALTVGAFLDIYRRTYWWLADWAFPRASIGSILANSIIVPATANDWEIEDDTRQRAVNGRLGVSIACYNFKLEVWFEKGGEGVCLSSREQNHIRRAIRQRIRVGRRERTLASFKRADENKIALAERFIATYDRTAA